jgi:hypothetical protein
MCKRVRGRSDSEMSSSVVSRLVKPQRIIRLGAVRLLEWGFGMLWDEVNTSLHGERKRAQYRKNMQEPHNIHKPLIKNQTNVTRDFCKIASGNCSCNQYNQMPCPTKLLIYCIGTERHLIWMACRTRVQKAGIYTCAWCRPLKTSKDKIDSIHRLSCCITKRDGLDERQILHSEFEVHKLSILDYFGHA